MNIEIDVNINKWVKDYDPITINKILKSGYFMYTEFNFDINPLENQFNSIKSDLYKFANGKFSTIDGDVKLIKKE